MSESKKTWAWYYEDEPIQGTGSDLARLIDHAIGKSQLDGREVDDILVGELITLSPSDLIDAECVLDEIKSAFAARLSTAESVTAIPEFQAALAWIVNSCVKITPSEICDGRTVRSIRAVYTPGLWTWGSVRGGYSVPVEFFYNDSLKIWMWNLPGCSGNKSTLMESLLSAERQLFATGLAFESFVQIIQSRLARGDHSPLIMEDLCTR